MVTLSSGQNRTARIEKLTKTLVKMRPGRRRGDVAAQQRINGELERLRAVEVRDRRTPADPAYWRIGADAVQLLRAARGHLRVLIRRVSTMRRA